MQTIKNLLNKMFAEGKTLAETLVAIRSTPVGDGFPSLAVLLQGRNMRSSLHCHTDSLKPTVEHTHLRFNGGSKRGKAPEHIKAGLLISGRCYWAAGLN